MPGTLLTWFRAALRAGSPTFHTGAEPTFGEHGDASIASHHSNKRFSLSVSCFILDSPKGVNPRFILIFKLVFIRAPYGVLQKRTGRTILADIQQAG